MSALSGFAVIGVIVVAGWVAARWGRLPAGTESVAGKLAYTVLSPCLLFTSAAAADPGALLTEPLLVSAVAAILCFALHTVTTRGRDLGTRIVGALGAGYVNAAFIGIPIAMYVLDDTALVVPIFMLQLLVFMPVTVTLLEIATTGHTSWRTSLTVPLRSPLTVAVLLGIVVSVTGVRLPSVLTEPVAAMGDAAAPVVLVAFGMSLSGRRLLESGPDRVPVLAAVVLKAAVMPAIAFLLASVLRLNPAGTYAVTVLAALPAAQNVFLYAQAFGRGVVLARDTVFLSTLACMPALVTIAILHTLT
ncbi:membrane protein [Paractinoplanes abujensis]|uniref:Putative permease n=1 Tax=Paractinoplanes abujensis TaxID=882441 RepID=A0A7W7G352_9ACTN|nr:AEC family transporter [Actinoplanes abujensis]MBB4692351.1 putative permease [Actinoplanes abujensis]GID24171.1 membrane protein [Actinoplanes abujensis]